VISAPPSSRLRGTTARQAHLRPTVAGLRRGREVISESEWLTEFIASGTLFVSWIGEFMDGFFLSPGVVNAAIAGLKTGEEAIGRSAFCPIQI